MVSREEWILEFWVRISSAVLHLRSYRRTLRILQFYTYNIKASRRATARLSLLHHTVCWLSLSEVATAAIVYSISNFIMAAYRRGRSLMRYDWPGLEASLGKACVWKSILSPAVPALVSVTEISSKTGLAPQQWVESWTTQQCLRWPTAPATGYPRLKTSKAVTTVFLCPLPSRSSSL